MKLQLYPKTKRISFKKEIMITEKLDGSNIGFFKRNGELIIATRNNVFKLSEIQENENLLYRGMKGWLKENGEDLRDKLIEGSGFFGEWIGMGQIKYPNLDKKVYMFAKANIETEPTVLMCAKKIYYDRELFIYPFENQQIPEYIGIVPLVYEGNDIPTKEFLDNLYSYRTLTSFRDIEGFIIINNNNITKYVRIKNGKLEDYRENVFE